MNFLNKTFWKFAAVFTAIIVFGWISVQLVQYYQWRKSPNYEAEKYLNELEQKYRDDTYGGNTPEETLQLFIDALKNNDINLASKYFVVDKQEEWKEKLEKIKNNGLLQNMTSDLSRDKEKQIISENRIVFYIYNNNNLLAVSINIVKNINNKWKIEDI